MSTIKMQLALGLSLGLALPALVLAADLETPSIDPVVESIIPDKNPMDHEHKPRSLMMRFKESATPADRAALLAELGGTVRTSYTLVPGAATSSHERSAFSSCLPLHSTHFLLPSGVR